MSENKGTKYLSFRDPVTTEVLLGWWRGLDDARGERAVLRRCSTHEEVAFSPEYHRLRRDLQKFSGRVDAEKLAIVAGVLSHVRENLKNTSFAELMATPKLKGASPRVSEIRFRRLLSVKDPASLYPTMIRLVRMTDGKAPIGDLANGLYWWNDRTKKNWAFAYYEKIV